VDCGAKAEEKREGRGTSEEKKSISRCRGRSKLRGTSKLRKVVKAAETVGSESLTGTGWS